MWAFESIYITGSYILPVQKVMSSLIICHDHSNRPSTSWKRAIGLRTWFQVTGNMYFLLQIRLYPFFFILIAGWLWIFTHIMLHNEEYYMHVINTKKRLKEKLWKEKRYQSVNEISLCICNFHSMWILSPILLLLVPSRQLKKAKWTIKGIFSDLTASSHGVN